MRQSPPSGLGPTRGDHERGAEPQASGTTGMMLMGVLMIPWMTLAISEV
jgi:hypothetical protein